MEFGSLQSSLRKKVTTERQVKNNKVKPFQIQPYDLDTSKGPLTLAQSQEAYQIQGINSSSSRDDRDLNESGALQTSSALQQIQPISNENYIMIHEAIDHIGIMKNEIMNEVGIMRGSHQGKSRGKLKKQQSLHQNYQESTVTLKAQIEQAFQSYQNTNRSNNGQLGNNDIPTNIKCSHSNPQLTLQSQKYYETINFPPTQGVKGKIQRQRTQQQCPNCYNINEKPQLNINISINIQNNQFNNGKNNINDQQTGKMPTGINNTHTHNTTPNHQEDEEEEQKDEVHTIQSGISPRLPQRISQRSQSDNGLGMIAHTLTGGTIGIGIGNHADNFLFENGFNQNFRTQHSTKSLNHSAQKQRSNSFYESTNAQRKWMKIKNVFKGVSLMRSNIVKTLQDPDEIVETINNSPRRKRNDTFYSMSSLNLTKCALDDIRNQDRFFDLIEKGGDNAIPLLVKELENDPKKHFYDRNSPYHLINKVNRINQTPIYVACRNGNLSIVKWLLDQEANPHTLSNVDKNEQENIIQVAARWNHLQIVEYLLGRIKWNRSDIKKVIKMKGNSDTVKIILKKHCKTHYNCLFNFCTCYPA